MGPEEPIVPFAPHHDLQSILPDHPHVRAALWHLDGLRQEGMAPDLWLTGRERAEVAAYGHERRRREWLAARIALKRLLVQEGIVRSPLHAEVRKNELGQPRVVVYVPDTGHYEELTCSLGHKNQLVVAAFSQRRVRVGIDIERRSWRLSHLRRRFEAPGDQLLPGPDSIARFTLLWAFKEAVSKLLGLGFACGFTQVSCRETKYGACEIAAPGESHLYGLYVWHDRYAIAVVTDFPVGSEASGASGTTPVRPWFEQVARANRLRKLRRARAVTATLATPQAPDSETPPPRRSR